jgi:ribonuclease Z
LARADLYQGAVIDPLHDPERLLAALPDRPRALFVGAGGRGKSTLLRALAGRLGCPVICADPGQPAFGPPGALSLGRLEGGLWRADRSAGLATLDAIRWRQPLVSAAARLARGVSEGPLLVDAPGVWRGLTAAELVEGLAAACGLNAAVVIERAPGEAEALADALGAAGLALVRVRSHPAARDDSSAARARLRTEAWERCMAGAPTWRLALAGLRVIGTRPPLDDPEAWAGRVAALLDGAGETAAMAEVVALEGEALALRAPPVAGIRALVLRDARLERGRLRSAPLAPRAERRPARPRRVGPIPLDLGPAATLGGATAQFLGTLFDDPTLHLRLARRQESLLFDLGDSELLTRRLAHQVRAAFVSHAHQDHFAAFPRLVRGRTDLTAPCLLFGPEGLAERAAAFVDGFTWDRIGDGGPRFTVGELRGETLAWFEVRAGQRRPRPAGEAPAPGGLLLDDPEYEVHGLPLDHAGLTVLAFSFRWKRLVSIDGERLTALGLTAGPWLGQLRRRFMAGDEGEIARPDGAVVSVQALAAEVLTVREGPRLVYATDLGDTPGNRAALAAFAREATALVCEASFQEVDADRAAKTGHLTARACGEIAAAAGARWLVPFHLSARYEEDPGVSFDEVRAAFPDVVAPAL